MSDDEKIALTQSTVNAIFAHLNDLKDGQETLGIKLAEVATNQKWVMDTVAENKVTLVHIKEEGCEKRHEHEEVKRTVADHDVQIKELVADKNKILGARSIVGVLAGGIVVLIGWIIEMVRK